LEFPEFSEFAALRAIDTSTKISDAFLGPFFGEMKEKAIHGWSFW
jgi:hypothetical protein